MSEQSESPHQQIERLAAFIMAEMPGEPSKSEGAVDTAIRLMGEWKDRAQKLWAIADDIDTYDDLAKGNQELYRNLVRKKHVERFEILESDGYDLFIPGSKPPEAKPPEDRQEVMKFNGG